jgi:hypothetical protein
LCSARYAKPRKGVGPFLRSKSGRSQRRAWRFVVSDLCRKNPVKDRALRLCCSSRHQASSLRYRAIVFETPVNRAEDQPTTRRLYRAAEGAVSRARSSAPKTPSARFLVSDPAQAWPAEEPRPMRRVLPSALPTAAKRHRVSPAPAAHSGKLLRDLFPCR